MLGDGNRPTYRRARRRFAASYERDSHMKVALLLSSLLLQPAAPAELKAFTFRGLEGGKTVPSTDLGMCGNLGPDYRTCLLKERDFAGVSAPIYLFLVGDALSSIKIEFDARDFGTVEEAFKIKYGSPCKKWKEPWQNAMGARSENLIQQWCFLTGNLQLRSIGDRLGRSLASYDDRLQPVSSPKIDF